MFFTKIQVRRERSQSFAVNRRPREPRKGSCAGRTAAARGFDKCSSTPFTAIVATRAKPGNGADDDDVPVARASKFGVRTIEAALSGRGANPGHCAGLGSLRA